MSKEVVVYIPGTGLTEMPTEEYVKSKFCPRTVQEQYRKIAKRFDDVIDARTEVSNLATNEQLAALNALREGYDHAPAAVEEAFKSVSKDFAVGLSTMQERYSAAKHLTRNAVRWDTPIAVEEAAIPSTMQIDRSLLFGNEMNRAMLPRLREAYLNDGLSMLLQGESFNNLNEHKFLHTDALENIAVVGEGEPYPVLHTEDHESTGNIAKYGAIVGRTLEMKLNDTMKALDEMPALLADSMGRARHNAIAAAMNGMAVISTTAISVAGLNTVRARFKNQATPNALHSINPYFLVVGEAFNDTLIETARQILLSERVNRTGDQSPEGNTLNRAMVLMGSPYLTANYYFVASRDANPKTFIEGRLNGFRTPVIEVENTGSLGSFDNSVFRTRIVDFFGFDMIRTYSAPGTATPAVTSIMRFQNS